MKKSTTYVNIFVLLYLIAFPLLSWSQGGGRVTGLVSDAAGLPLAGASVQAQGSSRGVVTENDGRYSLQLPAGNHTLIISFVGYTRNQVSVTVTDGGNTEQNITLTSSGELSNVTIVGSRNAARTRIETPVPVDVIPIAQVINEIGQVELNQIMNFIAPSYQSARQTISDGTDHMDPAQLRGLGTDQILVLINGKRRHQSALVNVNGTVNRGQVSTDMNAIPANAIERIEVLRDGAAAQYGSDAIAGVINIVLKRKTGIIDANLTVGQYNTRYDKNYALFKAQNKTDDPSVRVRDGETVQGSLSYGINVGKGFLALTGEYTSRGRTNRGGTYTGAVFPNVNGQNRDDSIMGARGLSRDDFDMWIGASQVKGGGAFYNFGLPVGKNAELYAFGGYTHRKGSSAGFYRYPSGIPGAATQYAPQVVAIYPNGFLPEIASTMTDFSTSVGIRTKIREWNMDFSNTYGSNQFLVDINNSANYTQFVRPGNTQTSFDAGGLRFKQNTINLDFTRNFPVLEGLNVAAGAEYRIDAFGIEDGEEASYQNFDTASRAAGGAQVFPGFRNFLGEQFKSRNAKAVYLDLEQDLTEKLLLTGALRFENYSDFGSTFNYKFSGRYKFSDALNLRASTSTGFRAPSLQQRYYAKTNTLFVSQGGQTVPVESGTFTNDSEAAGILGIPTLKQETSRNYSVGITARPLRSLEVTIDAYQINIKDRIVLTNNFTGGNNPALQEQLRAAGANTANFFTNAIDMSARGLEAVISHNLSRGKHSLRTIFAMTFIDNEVKKGADGKPIIKASPILVNSGQLGNYFNREDQSRIEVANPQDKISIMFSYKYSRFGAMLRAVRFGKVEYLDPGTAPALNTFTGNTETLDQTFDAQTVTDLSLSYQFKPWIGLTLGVNNLFDVYPDRNAHSSNMSLGRFVYSRRVQQMGFSGAYYFARLRFAIPTRS